MAAIGADPDSLDGLARALTGAGEELAATVGRLDAAVRDAGWDGPDGDRFARTWRSLHRAELRRASDRCASLARRVRRHADEQRRAATSTGAPTAATRLRPSTASGRVLDGSIEASIGPWSAGVAGTLRIDDLGRRRRVTYEEELGAGIGLTGGSGLRGTFEQRSAAAGTTGAAGVTAASTVRRTWTVDREEVAGLLAALALDGSLAGATGPLTRVGGQLTRAVGALTGNRVGPPALVEPERTEDLVSLRLGATGWASIGADLTGSRSAAGDVAGTVAVGVAAERGDSWLVLEADGAAAVALGELLSDGGPDAHGSLRIEVPLHGPLDRPMVLTATGRVGPDGDAEEVRIAVDPELAGDAVAAGRRALDAFARGDVDGAAAALRAVRWDPGAVAIEVTTIAVDGRDAGLDAVAGPASVSFSGSDEHWRRRP